MRRLLGTTLLLALLCPPPAWALRSAGPEAKGVTAGLEANLEPRDSATPAAGLEERIADPEARLRARTAQRMADSRAQVSATLTQDLTRHTVASEDVVALSDNLVQGPGASNGAPELYLHLHLFGPKPDREIQNGLLVRLTTKGRAIIPTDPWMEELTGGPFFRVEDLVPDAVAPLLDKTRDAIQQDLAALRNAMDQTPTMMLGVTMTPGAEGYRLILNRPQFDARERWVHDYSTGLTALRMDLQPSFPLPGEVRLSAAGDARAVLREWARSWNFYHRQNSLGMLPPVPAPDETHRVQVLTSSALTQASWLIPLLKTFPSALQGHLAVLSGDRARPLLNTRSGLVIEDRPVSLVEEIARQRVGCRAAQTALIVYSDDVQEVRDLRRAIRTKPHWRLVRYPTRRLSRSHLQKFSTQIRAAAVHASTVRDPMTPERKSEILYLTDRLEQWLAAPAAGLEEGALYWETLRRVAYDPTIPFALPSIRELRRRYTVSIEGGDFAKSPISRNLVKGPGGRYLLHLHIVPTPAFASETQTLHGLLFWVRVDHDAVALSDPWIEPLLHDGLFVNAADLHYARSEQETRQLVQWLVEEATKNVAPHRDALLAGMAKGTRQVLGFAVSQGAEGLRVVAQTRGKRPRTMAGDLTPGDTTWFRATRASGRWIIARRADTLAQFPSQEDLTPSARDEALAALRSWSLWADHRTRRFRDVQIVTQRTLEREGWLRNLLASWPSELAGTIGLVADPVFAATLHPAEGLVIGTTPADVLSALERRAAHAESRTLRLYTDDPSTIEVFQRLASPRWRLEVLPDTLTRAAGIPALLTRARLSLDRPGTSESDVEKDIRAFPTDFPELTQRLGEWLAESGEEWSA